MPQRRSPPPGRKRDAALVPEIEVRKPISEAFHRGRLYAFSTVDDAQHAAEVEPGKVTVGCLAGGQVESEVRRCRKRMRSAGQRSAPIWQAFPETQPDSTIRRDSRSGSVHRLPAPTPCRGTGATTTRSWHPAEFELGSRSAKKLRISCSKFTWTLRYEIITPVGSRVEPELYCKYETLGEQVSHACSAVGVEIQRVDFDDLRRGIHP